MVFLIPLTVLHQRADRASKEKNLVRSVWGWGRTNELNSPLCKPISPLCTPISPLDSSMMSLLNFLNLFSAGGQGGKNPSFALPNEGHWVFSGVIVPAELFTQFSDSFPAS